MPISPDAVGSTSEGNRWSWTSDEALLYALGVGAGVADPVAQELEFTTENTSGVTQQALPSFCVISAHKARGGTSALASIGSFDPRMLVHGEQGFVLHRPMPVSGEVTITEEVTGIYDKGKGAVVATKSSAVSVEDGQPLFDLTSSVFIVGEGGFGGERGPSGQKSVAPDREPDLSITYQTRPDQALLYRLSGDRNPLHADKQFSDVGGFPRPILHGLCTYGFTARALLRGLCDGDPTRFTAMSGRFTSPVLPGEALTIKMWRGSAQSDGVSSQTVFQTVADDGRVVIDNGSVTTE